MTTSPYQVAKSWLGLKELAGPLAAPLVLAMLQLDGNTWVKDDATAWCSAFVNFICKQLGLPRSKSLAARSWLKVGTPVALADARPDADVVVLRRMVGGVLGPGPEVLEAPGHVGFFSGYDSEPGLVYVLGGNQHDEVSIAAFPESQVLGVRRLAA